MLVGESAETTTAPVDSIEVDKAEYEAVAAFRYAIRRFLRFSEQAARHAGVTPQQHQLLLTIKGFREPGMASVSDLAERLQMLQHSMVGLIDRTEAQGLVRRIAGQEDRRQVFVTLTAAGEAVLATLAAQHRRELLTMREALLSVTSVTDVRVPESDGLAPWTSER